MFILSDGINLSESDKVASIPTENDMGGGFVFVDKAEEENKLVRKISFRVVSSVSESISLGVGDVSVLKDKNFMMGNFGFM